MNAERVAMWIHLAFVPYTHTHNKQTQRNNKKKIPDHTTEEGEREKKKSFVCCGFEYQANIRKWWMCLEI